MNEALPALLAILIAVIGGAGGIAALMKVNADNSKVVSEGATSVVKMLRDQVADLDARLSMLEQYADAMEGWSERVLDLTVKAIESLPEVDRDPFRFEHDSLALSRPRRRVKRIEG